MYMCAMGIDFAIIIFFLLNFDRVEFISFSSISNIS